MTDKLIVRVCHDMIGKAYTVGTRTGPLYIVFFFTWADKPVQPNQKYFALFRGGVNEAWTSIPLPRNPTTDWVDSDWADLAFEIVDRHLASYEGERPTRFERDDVI